VETNTPVYNTSNPGDGLIAEEATKGWSPEIGHFLFGGMSYGYLSMDPKGHFLLNADHNKLQKGHNQILSALVLNGLLKPEIPHRNMANLEYATFPRDELGSGANTLVELDIQAMQEHIDATLDAASQERTRPVPGTESLLTGIPKKAILTWVAANKGNVEVVGGYIDAMQKMIDDAVYLQQTAGVLPEDIPDLYERGSKILGSGNTLQGLVMGQLLAISNALAKAAFSATAEESPIAIKQQAGPVVGYLAFLASYLLADSVSLTDMVKNTPKNLLPYFPKARLEVSFKALPEGLRAETAYWQAAFTVLVKESTAYLDEYWIKTFAKAGLGPGSDEEANSLIFDDARGKRDKALETLIKLATGEELEIGLEKGDLGLDELPPSLQSVTKQKGIPLEDRYVGTKAGKALTYKNMGDVLRGGFLESQAALLGHSATKQEDLERVKEKPTRLGLARLKLATLKTQLVHLKGYASQGLFSAEFDLGEEGFPAALKPEQESLDEVNDKIEKSTHELEENREELEKLGKKIRTKELELAELQKLELSINQMSNVIGLEDEINTLRDNPLRDLVWEHQTLLEEKEEYEREIRKIEGKMKDAKERFQFYAKLVEGIKEISEKLELEVLPEDGELLEGLVGKYTALANRWSADLSLMRNRLSEKDKPLSQREAFNYLLKQHAGDSNKLRKKFPKNPAEAKEGLQERLFEADKIDKAILSLRGDGGSTIQEKSVSLSKLLELLNMYNKIMSSLEV